MAKRLMAKRLIAVGRIDRRRRTAHRISLQGGEVVEERYVGGVKTSCHRYPIPREENT